MDLPTYIGKIALQRRILSLMLLTTNAKDQQTHTNKLFIVSTLIVLYPDIDIISDQILTSFYALIR